MFMPEKIGRDNINSIASHYDDLYSRENNVFNHNPLEVMNLAHTTFPKEYPILDAGAGDGMSALTLVNYGYDVDVVDISAVAIKKLKEKAIQQDAQTLNTSVGSICQFESHKLYGGVIMSLVLHHMTFDDACTTIKRLQDMTSAEGVHLVITFTDEGDFFKAKKHSENFYPAKNELLAYYDKNEWEIMYYSEIERPVRELHSDGTKKKNTVARLVARKK